ncbi:MAG: mechanosensitive ion channel family protein [Candidatus Dadabacteria bacterium]|nr:MAG: mechanosensitive ion channel family protein [Candidatus Dadabacteria bacterium]
MKSLRNALSILTAILSLIFLAYAFFPSSFAQEGAKAKEAQKETVEEPDPDLQSPRAVFKTFLTAMKKYKSGDKEAIKDALKCLDFSALPPFVKKEKGEELAIKLLASINRIRYVVYSRIPAHKDGDPYVFYKSKEGRIVIEKVGANWKFSKETVEAVPAIYLSLADKPPVKGAVTEIQYKSLAFKIRSFLPPVFSKKFIYLELWQWAAGVVLLILTYLSYLILFQILKFFLRRGEKRFSFLRNTALLERLARPLALFILANVLIGVCDLLDMPLLLYKWVLLFLSLLKIFSFLVVLYRGVDILAEFLLAGARRTVTNIDDILIPLLQKIGRVLVVIYGIIALASLFEVNITSLIAGLGLGGLAFALAAKDTVENLFGSITVLLDQPFKVGDYIRLEGIEGTVEAIGLRSTRIRTPYNSLVSLPNSKLISTSVDNLGARQYRRTRTMLSLTYDTPPEKIEAFCEGVRELIKAHPKTRKDYFHVHLNEFSASSLDVILNVYFYAKDFTTELALKEELFLAIIKLANKLGVEFAFPTQTVHLASTPGEPPPEVKVSDVAKEKEKALEIAKKLAANFAK